jgi:hypothetical protein
LLLFFGTKAEWDAMSAEEKEGAARVDDDLSGMADLVPPDT